MKLWIFLSLPASTLYAQEFRATLTGRVVDPSDAPIPGVEIVVRNLGTNIAHQARTDANGNYTIMYLPPGDYAVSAAAPGFQSTTRSDLHLTVSQTAAMDFKLALGVVSHEVIVKADVPLLEQSSADRGSIIGKWHLGLGDGQTRVNFNGEVQPGPLEIGFDYAHIIPATVDRVPSVWIENQVHPAF